MKPITSICKHGVALAALALQAGSGLAAPDLAPANRPAVHPVPSTRHVTPPPRPAGSQQVVLDAGESPDLVVRNHRAHHDKSHLKKDMTRDDTIDAPAPSR